MKGSLAVMMELAIDRAARAPPARARPGLRLLRPRGAAGGAERARSRCWSASRACATADLAVVMEPTASALQAGCLGNVNATWTFRGRSGHSARPWLADNAIHRAAHGIAALAQVEPVEHVFDGLTYTEVVSVTMVAGGIAENVIPGPRHGAGELPLPARASRPSRRPSGCTPCAIRTASSRSPRTPRRAPVPLDNPLVDRLCAAGDLPREPKQAWTPVAEFGAAGIDAVNFGPGEPPHAHTRDERVAVADLVRAYEILDAFASA